MGDDQGVLNPGDGLQVGEAVPVLTAFEQRNGQPVSLPDSSGRPVALIFLSPSCRTSSLRRARTLQVRLPPRSLPARRGMAFGARRGFRLRP